MGLCPSVCPSVCLSVTSQCSTKTAESRMTHITSAFFVKNIFSGTSQNNWNFWTANLIMRAKKLLTSRQIFRYAVPARTVTKKALHITPHNNPGSLVFWRQRSPRNSTGITPCGGAKGWVKIGDFRQIAGYISKTVQDRRMVSINVE